MTEPPGADTTFRSALPILLFVALIFFFNFISRVALAPLLPAIEADLGVSHSEAGRLFLMIASGYGVGLLFSGLVSSRMIHRKAIVLSSVSMGLWLLAAAWCRDLFWFRAMLLCVGACAGIYLPSGIATVTSVVRARDWGKALAVHELAPNLSLVAAPLLAEAMLAFFPWRSVLWLLGGMQIILGLAFLRWGRGGGFRGRALRPGLAAGLVKRPEFWVLGLVFSLALGASFGPFSMTTVFLAERGFSRPEANHLLALARAAALAMPFAAGWFADRVGVRPALVAAMAATGVLTLLLGLCSGGLLVAAVIAQPAFSCLFFPVGFAALSRVFDPETRSAAVAMIIPAAIVIGLGLIPSVLGHLGQHDLFEAGFVGLGAAMLLGMAVLPLLKGSAPKN
ncbi:MAG: MFS transporter [Desulfovibrionaceae bacterium]|nr:MFS transporter [Desulfovibrionaceae bacterium]